MTRVVLIGSGETAPSMVRLHREVLAAAGEGPAVLLDTPFAFQTNADELVSRTRGYFADSVGRTVTAARWPRADAPLLDRERALALLGTAVWAFAGPGSPSYALRQWRDTPLPDALAELARRGGTLVFGSAAAVTVGSHAVPVYEIYKVGEEPRWLAGLDLLGRLAGIRAAVVPHYDNAEGATHDTRYCYLGERRLAALETSLPDEVGVLGVDEHTALLLDVAAGSARVAGTGAATVRRRGRETRLPAGSELALTELAALLRGERAPAGPATGADRERPAERSSRDDARPGPHGAPSLRAAAEAAEHDFDAALDRRDVDAAVAAALELESAIVAWAADTLQSDERPRARAGLRALVVRLGELARLGAVDPASVLAPYLDLLVEVRDGARRQRDFATADLVRDRLAGAGVELRDGPAGTSWHLRGPVPGQGTGEKDPNAAPGRARAQ